MARHFYTITIVTKYIHFWAYLNCLSLCILKSGIMMIFCRTIYLKYNGKIITIYILSDHIFLDKLQSQVSFSLIRYSDSTRVSGIDMTPNFIHTGLISPKSIEYQYSTSFICEYQSRKSRQHLQQMYIIMFNHSQVSS